VRRIRPRLTYANVMVTILAFILVGGGSALAAVVITSNSQVAPNTISGHKPPSGKHPNMIAGSINGKDIADRSGVDTCRSPLVKKYGPICAGTDGASRLWLNALDHCAKFNLRLPTLGEAIVLARKHINGLSAGDAFWTDETYYQDGPQASVVVYFGDGSYEPGSDNTNTGTDKTVCVTDPSA
jgi:hypothetical protein